MLLGVMMAFTKTVIATDLADDDLLTDAAGVRLLAEYFPAPLRERYAGDIARHALRNELIAAIAVVVDGVAGLGRRRHLGRAIRLRAEATLPQAVLAGPDLRRAGLAGVADDGAEPREAVVRATCALR